MKQKKTIQFRNNSESSVDMYITGDILDDSWKGWMWGEDENTYPSNIRNLLKEYKGKNINVYINSGGGDVFASVAISNMLARHDGKTKAIVDGLAASGASVIAFGCNEIEIPENAFLMIHKPSVGIRGTADDLRNTANTLDVIQEGITNTYLKKTKEDVGAETVTEMINNETWLTGTEASKYFDVIVSDKKEILNCISEYSDSFKNIPESLMKSKNHSDQEINSRKIKEIEIELNL